MQNKHQLRIQQKEKTEAWNIFKWVLLKYDLVISLDNKEDFTKKACDLYNIMLKIMKGLTSTHMES